MIDIHLIGIGAGSLAQVTQEAYAAIAAADVIFLPSKGAEKADLLQLRQAICAAVPAEKLITFILPKRGESANYRDDVDAWHDQIAQQWQQLLDTHLAGGGQAGFLIWGDPSLYDSSIRIAKRLQQNRSDIALHIVPGITSLQALTAAHQITLNELAEPVLITTGRQLRENGWPAGVDTVAVMLDAGGAFQAIAAEHKQIWWGAYLGMDKQCLINGELASVADEIVERRAALRQQHGWIMDIYVIKHFPPKVNKT